MLIRHVAWLRCVVAIICLLAAPVVARAQYGVSLAACSACVGNGTTDDTAAVQAFLNANAGNTIVVPQGKYYLIGTANLTIPSKTMVIGEGNPFILTEALANPIPPDAFYLTPPHSVVMSWGSTLENVSVYRAGLTSAPTDAQVVTEVTQWGTESSAGISIPANTGTVVLERLSIVGFNTGISIASGQFYLHDIYADDYNGVYITSAASVNTTDVVHLAPWICISSSNCTGSGGGMNRPGVGIYLQGAATNIRMSKVFTFGFNQGFILDGIAGSEFYNDGAEWNTGQGASIYDGYGSSALRVLNRGGGILVDGIYANGQATPYDLETVGDIDIVSARYSPPSLAGALGVAEYYLQSPTAIPLTTTFTGTAAAGLTASLSVASSALRSTPVIFNYVTSASDTLSSIASRLEFLVNSNTTLAGAHFYAAVSGAVVTVYAPAGTTYTVTPTTSGTLTTSTGVGTANGGFIGTIRDIDDYGPDTSHPLILTGGNVGRTRIDGVKEIFSGWLSGPGNNAQISFSGIPGTISPTVSGTGCATALANTIDAGGNIQETTASLGCTVTFGTPWIWAPNCTVQGMSGDNPSSITVTTTMLAWTNSPPAANEKWRYSCGFY